LENSGKDEVTIKAVAGRNKKELSSVTTKKIKKATSELE